MDEKLYNEIKKKYGKHASWAVWGSNFKVPPYKEIAGKLKPNIVFVGLNPPDGIIMPLDNYHWKHPNTGNPGNDKKLRHAFEGTKLEGAYMTDIIKYDTIENLGRATNSSVVMNYINNNPNVKAENIKRFKEELEFIGAENPLLIALGGDAYRVLSEQFGDNFNLILIDPIRIKLIQIYHHSYRHKGCSDPEVYKKTVWQQISSCKIESILKS